MLHKCRCPWDVLRRICTSRRKQTIKYDRRSSMRCFRFNKHLLIFIVLLLDHKQFFFRKMKYGELGMYLAVICVMLLLLYCKSWLRSVQVALTLPGPPALPLIGNALLATNSKSKYKLSEMKLRFRTFLFKYNCFPKKKVRLAHSRNKVVVLVLSF